MPESSGAAIVHGDYRLDNLLVAGPAEPDALQVRAVLDWEMATLGDPLADLGLLLAYWDTLSRIPNEVARSMGEQAGFPPGATLAGWYTERRGADLSLLPWYQAFGLFKLAVIIEGIHYRLHPGPDGRRGLRPDRRRHAPAGGRQPASSSRRCDSGHVARSTQAGPPGTPR